MIQHAVPAGAGARARPSPPRGGYGPPESLEAGATRGRRNWQCQRTAREISIRVAAAAGRSEPGRGTIIPAAQRALLCAAQPSCGAAGPADARLGAVGYRFYNRIARCKAGIIDSPGGRAGETGPAGSAGPGVRPV